MKLKKKDLICMSLILLLIYVVFERNDNIPQPFTFNALVNVGTVEGNRNRDKDRDVTRQHAPRWYRDIIGSVERKEFNDSNMRFALEHDHPLRPKKPYLKIK